MKIKFAGATFDSPEAVMLVIAREFDNQATISRSVVKANVYRDCARVLNEGRLAVERARKEEVPQRLGPVDLCPHCHKPMEVGDEDPEERCCNECSISLAHPEHQEACPGCGKRPGEGLTEGCEDPLGCGFWRPLYKEMK